MGSLQIDTGICEIIADFMQNVFFHKRKRLQEPVFSTDY